MNDKENNAVELSDEDMAKVVGGNGSAITYSINDSGSAYPTNDSVIIYTPDTSGANKVNGNQIGWT